MEIGLGAQGKEVVLREVNKHFHTLVAKSSLESDKKTRVEAREEANVLATRS